MTNRWAISNLFLKQKKISIEVMREIQRTALEKSLSEQQAMQELGVATEDDIVDLFFKIYGYEKVNLEEEPFDMECLATMTQDACLKLLAIPVRYTPDGDSIIVAIADPTNITALETLKLYTTKNIEFRISKPSSISSVVNLVYSKMNGEVATKELQSTGPVEVEEENKDGVAGGTGSEDSDDPIVKLTNSILVESIVAKASDIHIEPFEKYMSVRIRVDGKLRQILKLPIQSFAAVCTRYKIVAGMDISEKRIPQEGSIKMKHGGKSVDIRVSTLPNVFGEKIVMRIASKDAISLPKEKLGFSKSDLDKITQMLGNPHGIILVTGPAGSGKSTTLYSCLNDLKTPDKAVITVEDPVEFTIDGINQVPVNAKQGMTFPVALKSILRQDPDVIMVGEIRDAETAAIAVRASITGHLVLSTIHTNDSASTIARLSDMNIESYLLGDSIRGIIAQRLLRRICPHCHEEYLSSIREMSLLKINAPTPLVKAVGCKHCNYSGYKGRVGIYEILLSDKKIRSLIERGAKTEEITAAAVEAGMQTLVMAGIEKVLEKLTTVEELQGGIYDV